MSISETDPQRLLIVGCGYVGQRVARLAREAGHIVYALTRARSRFSELRALDAQPLLGHWLESASLRSLPEVDRVLISVPHRVDEHDSAGSSSAETHARGIDNLVNALPAGWQKLVYSSTTGVYGHDSQELVNENTPVSPTRPGPQMAVAAEQWLCAHLQSERFTVLRLAGIYGPGRVPLADKLRRNEPLLVPRDGFLNLVHVTDIAHMLMAVLQRPMCNSIYVFSDGQPVLRETFYRYLAELCGVREPVFAIPESHDDKTRRATNKRLDPSRIAREVGFAYRFPDYRLGLADALLTAQSGNGAGRNGAVNNRPGSAQFSR